MTKLEKGLVQVYTGNGKGKTSAAFGLALRAAGRGLKVYIIQFIKGGFDYGELYVIDMIPNITLKAFGRGKFITDIPPSRQDYELAQAAFSLSKEIVEGGKYDVVVLDEINVAVQLGLVDVDEVLKLIKGKPEHVELVLTGRYASNRVVEVSDLVTEMQEIKHPFRGGTEARMGIEY